MIRKVTGFTLVEMLVVLAVLSIVGTLILTIFTRTLKGSNKAQIIGSIKQNGQLILETMDKTIRNADHLICVCPSSDYCPPTMVRPEGGVIKSNLVVVKDGIYTRFDFIIPSSSSNGFVEWASFQLPDTHPDGTEENLYVAQFDQVACINPMRDLITNSNVVNNVSQLTDTNTQTGVSVTDLTFTEESHKAGYKDVINVSLTLAPGVGAPASIAGQIDPVAFQTTIQLR